MSSQTIGSTKFMKGIAYISVNNQGTLEKLGYCPWYKQLKLEFLEAIGKPMPINKVRKYIRSY